MLLSEEEKKTIVKAYEYGDLTWLENINETVNLKEYFEGKDDILALLRVLFKMNYIVIETETEDYASKYESDIKDIYGEMKCDLMKRLNFEDFWQHFNF